MATGGRDQAEDDRFPLLFLEDIMAEQMRPKGMLPPRRPGEKPTAQLAVGGGVIQTPLSIFYIWRITNNISEAGSE
jgi:hypothetical protein